MEAVVRRIVHLTSADADTKVLVFSTWQDLLDVVAHALAANGVPFAACQGRTLAQSVRDFQAGAVQTSAGAKGRCASPSSPSMPRCGRRGQE